MILLESGVKRDQVTFQFYYPTKIVFPWLQEGLTDIRFPPIELRTNE